MSAHAEAHPAQPHRGNANEHPPPIHYSSRINPAIVGIFLFLGSSVPFVMGLKHGELSVLYPMVALGYVWALFWSRLFFNEAITKPKIAALAMILAGIVCIGAGGR